MAARGGAGGSENVDGALTSEPRKPTTFGDAALSYASAVAREDAARESGELELIKLTFPAAAPPVDLTFPGVVVAEEERHVGRIPVGAFATPPLGIHVTPGQVVSAMFPVVKTLFASDLLRRHIVLAGGAVSQIALAISSAGSPAEALRTMRSWRPEPKAAHFEPDDRDQYDSPLYQLKMAPGTIGVGDLDLFVVGVSSISQAELIRKEIDRVICAPKWSDVTDPWNDLALGLDRFERYNDGWEQTPVRAYASSATSFTWVLKNGHPDIQLITILNWDAAHVVYSFDNSAAGFVFDGDELYATPLSYWTLRSTIIPVESSRMGSAFSTRLLKYHLEKGWSIGLPDNGVDLTVARHFAGHLVYSPNPPRLELDEAATDAVAGRTTDYGEMLGRELGVARGEPWFKDRSPRGICIRDCRQFLYNPCNFPMTVSDELLTEASVDADVRHIENLKALLGWLSDSSAPDPPDYLLKMLLPEDIATRIDSKSWKLVRKAPALLTASEWRRAIAAITRNSRREIVRDRIAATIAPDLQTPPWIYAGPVLKGFSQKPMTLAEWYGTPLASGTSESKEAVAEQESKGVEDEGAVDPPEGAPEPESAPKAPKRIGFIGAFGGNIRGHILGALGLKPLKAPAAKGVAETRAQRQDVAHLVASFGKAIRTTPVVVHTRRETAVDRNWLTGCVGPWGLMGYTLGERREVVARFLELVGFAFDRVGELLTNPPTTLPRDVAELDDDGRYEGANALFLITYIATLGVTCYSEPTYRQLYLLIGWMRREACYDENFKTAGPIVNALANFRDVDMMRFPTKTSDPYPPPVRGAFHFVRNLINPSESSPFVNDSPDSPLSYDGADGTFHTYNPFGTLCHPAYMHKPHVRRVINSIGNAVLENDWEAAAALAGSLDDDSAAIVGATTGDEAGFTFEQMYDRMG